MKTHKIAFSCASVSSQTHFLHMPVKPSLFHIVFCFCVERRPVLLHLNYAVQIPKVIPSQNKETE
jgi:hypothetical protein